MDGHPDEKDSGSSPQAQVHVLPEFRKLEEKQACRQAPRNLTEAQSKAGQQPANPSPVDRQLDDPHGTRHHRCRIEQAEPDSTEHCDFNHRHPGFNETRFGPFVKDLSLPAKGFPL